MSQNHADKLVLIVDDNITNLKVAIEYLKSHDLEIITARNGESCLERAAYAQPDLILLDVQMPGIDGFETCRRLKENEATQDIPVIFMTALSDVADKVRGFEVGGVDYVTKPIQVEEVWARVQTHLTIRQLQQEMAERISELDAFAHTVAHDLKNPLSRIITGLDFLQFRTQATLDPDLRRILEISLSGSLQMAQIIDGLLLLASVRQEDVTMEPLPMQAIVLSAKQRVQHMIEESQAEVIMPGTWETAVGYAPWVEEVWANYLSNGLKYGGHPPRLQLGCDQLSDGTVRYWIQDNGEGLSEEEQGKLFQAFSRLDPHNAKGHGLGLSIVDRIINRLGGEVGVESVLGEGSTFYFTLPAANLNIQS
jgi:two-component system sensor histidine kinase/response regulator